MIQAKMNMDEFNRANQWYLKRSQNVYIAMQQIAARMEAEVMRRFQKTVSPDGQPWKPLKESTIKRRRKGSSVPLNDTGNLKRSILNIARHDRAEVFTNSEYAAIHNFGGPAKAWGKHPFKMPKRQFMWLSAAEVKRYNKLVQTYIIEGKL